MMQGKKRRKVFFVIIIIMNIKRSHIHVQYLGRLRRSLLGTQNSLPPFSVVSVLNSQHIALILVRTFIHVHIKKLMETDVAN